MTEPTITCIHCKTKIKRTESLQEIEGLELSIFKSADAISALSKIITQQN